MMTLLMGMKMSFTMKPMKPMIAKPTAVATLTLSQVGGPGLGRRGQRDVQRSGARNGGAPAS